MAQLDHACAKIRMLKASWLGIFWVEHNTVTLRDLPFMTGLRVEIVVIALDGWNGSGFVLHVYLIKRCSNPAAQKTLVVQ